MTFNEWHEKWNKEHKDCSYPTNKELFEAIRDNPAPPWWLPMSKEELEWCRKSPEHPYYEQRRPN